MKEDYSKCFSFGTVTHPSFLKLWDLMQTRTWCNYEIYAKTTKDIHISDERVFKAGTRVRVWMVSRFGDVGITTNLTNPKGYDIRGLDADKDLTDYEFIIKKQPMSEKRNLALTLAEARELYRKDAYTEALLLTAFTKEELEGKDELPTWEELRKIEGYSVNNVFADVYATANHPTITDTGYRFVFATQAQAKSALAMAQLSQLMKALGDECNVDWNDPNTLKETIYRYSNSTDIATAEVTYHFLAFKTASVRDAFLAKHIELIKQYFEL